MSYHTDQQVRDNKWMRIRKDRDDRSHVLHELSNQCNCNSGIHIYRHISGIRKCVGCGIESQYP